MLTPINVKVFPQPSSITGGVGTTLVSTGQATIAAPAVGINTAGGAITVKVAVNAMGLPGKQGSVSIQVTVLEPPQISGALATLKLLTRVVAQPPKGLIRAVSAANQAW